MKKSFLVDAVESCTELVDRNLFLAPRGLGFEIECRLNADGTLAMINDDSGSFTSPIELVRKFQPNFRGVNAPQDLFLERKRKKSVRVYVASQRSQNSSSSSSSTSSSTSSPSSGVKSDRKCRGFSIWPHFNAFAESEQSLLVRVFTNHF